MGEGTREPLRKLPEGTPSSGFMPGQMLVLAHQPTRQIVFRRVQCRLTLQVLTQCELLLLVFGRRTIRWTEYVVGVIFAFTHDVTLSNCRVPAGLSQWHRSKGRTA